MPWRLLLLFGMFFLPITSVDGCMNRQFCLYHVPLMKYLQTAGWSNLHPAFLYLQLLPYLHIPFIKNQYFLVLYLVSFFLTSECVLFFVLTCVPVFFLLLTYIQLLVADSVHRLIIFVTVLFAFTGILYQFYFFIDLKV